MDVQEQLKQQLAINRKINKKLPSELRLPETEQEFVRMELAILSDQLEVVKDKKLIVHMENRKSWSSGAPFSGFSSSRRLCLFFFQIT